MKKGPHSLVNSFSPEERAEVLRIAEQNISRDFESDNAHLTKIEDLLPKKKNGKKPKNVTTKKMSR